MVFTDSCSYILIAFYDIEIYQESPLFRPSSNYDITKSSLVSVSETGFYLSHKKEPHSSISHAFI
jgi:hypothetical protein